MSILSPDRAFVEGSRAGLRSIVLVRADPAPPILRRPVGSSATDRVARHRDMERFGADVRRRKRDVLTG